MGENKIEKRHVRSALSGILLCIIFPLFTALHGMQILTRSSDENSACLSVCLSIKRVHCDKTEERSVQIFTPYER